VLALLKVFDVNARPEKARPYGGAGRGKPNSIGFLDVVDGLPCWAGSPRGDGACSRGNADQNGDKAFTATELTKMIIANSETLLGSLVSIG
jgi:hypothetical protein